MAKKIYSVEIKKWIFILFWSLMGAFVFGSLQRAWVHPSGAHTHRQADTIGMSMMFAEELRSRGFAALDFLIYPKILQKGLLDGINASEFPLLNVITGPFFLFHSPLAGVFLSTLFILAFNIYVSYVYGPKLFRAFKLQFTGTFCSLLWFSIPALAGQSNVIMPEGVAFPLVLMGICKILEATQLNQSFYPGKHSGLKFLFGILLCNIGIAVKPTTIVMLAMFPMLLSSRENQKHIKKWGVALGLSILIPAYWYGIHAKHILSISQGPQIFALAKVSPLQKFKEVGQFIDLLKILKREILQDHFPMFLGWIFLVLAWFRKERLGIIFYILAFLGSVALGGGQVIVHAYYMIGVCLFSYILMGKVLGGIEKSKKLQLALIFILMWGMIYNTRYPFWIWARDSYYWKVNMWKMGDLAREQIPDSSYHLVTDDDIYPLKMLYVGQSGTPGYSQPFSVCDSPAYQKLPLAFVIESEKLPPQFCQGRQVEVKPIQTDFANWTVVLASPKNY